MRIADMRKTDRPLEQRLSELAELQRKLSDESARQRAAARTARGTLRAAVEASRRLTAAAPPASVPAAGDPVAPDACGPLVLREAAEGVSARDGAAAPPTAAAPTTARPPAGTERPGVAPSAGG